MGSHLVDSHAHLGHLAARGIEQRRALDRARAVGVRTVIDVAVDFVDFEDRARLAEDEGGVYLTVGLHPSASAGPAPAEIKRRIREQAAHPLVVAVGETGLDGVRDYAPMETQRAAFLAHLECAAELGLPIIVHNRDADSAVFAALDDAIYPGRGILHCFASDLDTARAAARRGFLISFAGNLTYKKNGFLRAVAAAIPSESVAAETDCPYLAPEPHRGRPNEPAFVHLVYEFLAAQRGLAVEDLADIVRTNLHGLMPKLG